MNGYVSLGYGVTLVSLALYTLRVMTRARSLSRVLVTRSGSPDPDPVTKTEGETGQ